MSDNQVFPDTEQRRLDASVQTRRNVFEKPCRIARMYGNEPSGVARTCSWAPCGSPVTPIGRQPTCDALLDAGVDPPPLFADKASGAREDRSSLQQALASIRGMFGIRAIIPNNDGYGY